MRCRDSASIIRRRGFTLVELLVVISIIAVLATLVTVFVFSAGDRRRAANTETAIQTVNKLLQKHWSQVIADAKTEDLSDTTTYQNLLNLSGATANLDPSSERARVILIKLRLMESFPVTYSEVTNKLDPVYQALQTYLPLNRRKYWKTYYSKLTAGGAPIQSNDPLTESSACLRMALFDVSRSGVSSSEDTLKHVIADSDGDGIKEFVDGWTQRPAPLIPPYNGEPTPAFPSNPQPMRFYRFAWNTAAYNLNHLIAAPGAANLPNDPVDSHGTLQNMNWYNSVGRGKTYEAVVGCVIKDPAFPNNPTYAIPVIASAGSDGYFGLPAVQIGGRWNTDLRQAAPMGALSVVNVAEADNIYSFSLRNQ